MPHRGYEPPACFDTWLAAFHILEMLYDTPYPNTPQNDLPGKPDRNAEIRARYDSGEQIVKLAGEFGISQQRVSEIIHQQQR